MINTPLTRVKLLYVKVGISIETHNDFICLFGTFGINENGICA